LRSLRPGARYGALKAWAEELHLREAADLLGQTLSEEKQTDLSKLAVESANRAASR